MLSSLVIRAGLRASCSVSRFVIARGFAEATSLQQQLQDIGKVIDPDDEAGKKAYNEWVSTVTLLSAQAQELGKPAPIDWDAYVPDLGEETVSRFRTMFEQGIQRAKSAYDPTQVAEEVKKNLNAELEPLFQEFEQQANAARDQIAALEKQVAEIDHIMQRLDTITVDEMLAEDPERAKQIDDEISRGDIYPWPAGEGDEEEAHH